MGILADALVIGIGCITGSRFKNLKVGYYTIGIAVMILSLVSFLENMYNIEGQRLSTDNLIIVLFAFIAGSKIGELLHIEEKLSTFGKSDNQSLNAFIDASLFFAIGGMQISGSITLALNHDNSQLYIKSLIDAPFALVFGSTYGKITALSAIPIALLQVMIVGVTFASSSFFDPSLTQQICAMGYIILFFSGFNLLSSGNTKISNINMLPGLILIILFHIIRRLAGGLL